LSALAVLTLAACATSGGNWVTPGRVIYQCDRGEELVIVFAADTARIENTGGPPIVMQQRTSSSGFWFDSGTRSIRGTRDRITYTVGRMAPMTCTALAPTPR